MPSIISHSEVDQFLVCERKHYYAFGKTNSEGTQGLESRHISDGLYKGNLGHAALEEYYKHLMQFTDTRPTDVDMDRAKDAALQVLTDRLVAEPDKSELILTIYTCLSAYFSYWRSEDQNEWQYMAVEVEFRETVDEYITFPFKPDLIKRHRRTGKVIVVDHKFLSNLYTPNEIGIQPQLPKYVGTLRNLGYQVDDAEYDMICTRVLKTKPYEASTSLKRTMLKLSKTRVERSVREQHDTVRRIAWFKAASPEAWEDTVTRSANSWNCKNCPFLSLCISDLNGEDTSVAVQYDFAPNSYGYDKKVDEVA